MLNKKYIDCPTEGERETLSVLTKVDVSAGEINEHIEQLTENPPTDKKLRKIWKRDVNKLIDFFNYSFGKRYNRIK